MKKYLPVLGVFLLLPLFFVQNNGLKVFEAKLTEVGDVYFNELGGVIPSDKIFYIPVYKAVEQEYRVEKSVNDLDGVDYAYRESAQTGLGRLDFDCDKYTGLHALRCHYLRFVAGEEPQTVITNLNGVLIDDSLSFFSYIGILGIITTNETNNSYDVPTTCSNYAKFAETNEPFTVCDKFFDGRLRQLCINDADYLLSLSDLEIQSADDFFCYYRTYLFLENLNVYG